MLFNMYVILKQLFMYLQTSIHQDPINIFKYIVKHV